MNTDFAEVGPAVAGIATSVTQQAKSLNRQRDFLDHVSEAVNREPVNLSALKRLLALPARTEVAARGDEVTALLTRLDEAVGRAWGEFALSVGATFRSLASAAGLQVDGQPPQITVGRGIDVVLDVTRNRAVVNGAVLQTVDPVDVLAKVKTEHDRLWHNPFDPEQFVDDLYRAYKAESARSSADAVPLLAVYERLRLDIPAPARKSFGPDVFAAQLSRALEVGQQGPGGAVLTLGPVADPSDALRVYLADRNERVYRGLLEFRRPQD